MCLLCLPISCVHRLCSIQFSTFNHSSPDAPAQGLPRERASGKNKPSGAMVGKVYAALISSQVSRGSIPLLPPISFLSTISSSLAVDKDLPRRARTPARFRSNKYSNSSFAFAISPKGTSRAPNSGNSAYQRGLSLPWLSRPRSLPLSTGSVVRSRRNKPRKFSFIQVRFYHVRPPARRTVG